MDKPFSVLFVCLGNTCRSTMSEGIFNHLVKSKGLQDKWRIDSAGIENWHEGKPPDEFTIEMLERNNMLDGYCHTARQITEADFMKFNFILGMDLYNIRCLKRKAPPNYTAKLFFMHFMSLSRHHLKFLKNCMLNVSDAVKDFWRYKLIKFHKQKNRL
ncbi:low molecular weight phosphotyrosine protein phosphatase 2-like [Saccostrea cucullata]|uniref:low molecular weight phosphotyrosine protein phosphatase 2-like n=1 Tax=Saccostrea cuccullata TaxID=36930 RepID=UPI002ED36576